MNGYLHINLLCRRYFQKSDLTENFFRKIGFLYISIGSSIFQKRIKTVVYVVKIPENFGMGTYKFLQSNIYSKNFDLEMSFSMVRNPIF